MRACLAAFVLAVASVVPLVAQQPPRERAWTFLIYGACDNDAETDGNFFRFLDGVRAELTDDPGLEVVLFLDRSDRYSTNATTLGEDFTDARLYRVGKDRCERLAGGVEFPEITLDGTWEPDSADPANVRKFLAFGKARFPARHCALMLYGHADGRAMCPDEQSRNEMGFAQLREAVPADLAIDLMALELCEMGGIEIAYEWRPGNGGFATQYLVAIPNAGPALDWHRVFARLRPGAVDAIDVARLAPEAFGRLIVEEGGRGRIADAEARPRRARALGYEAVACYDLGKVADAKRAIDALAVALAAGDHKATVDTVRGTASDPTLNYMRDRFDDAPFVDAFDLTTRLANSEVLGDGPRKAAAAAAQAIDALVVASWGGASLPRFTPGATGIYLTFPPGDRVVRRGDREEKVWSHCRWYTPLPVPVVYGKLAFCGDGAKPGNGVVENWFELLDSWYDAGAKDGGANRYAH